MHTNNIEAVRLLDDLSSISDKLSYKCYIIKQQMNKETDFIYSISEVDKINRYISDIQFMINDLRI